MMHMTDSKHHSTNAAMANAFQMPHATSQNHSKTVKSKDVAGPWFVNRDSNCDKKQGVTS